ncbi:ComF family protein [Salibacterium salarium]|nr:ComF family protein [Salibacterium salarium]
MSNCLYCGDSTEALSSWTTLFSSSAPTLCSTCENGLTPITGTVCSICGRPRIAETICEDCKRWEASSQWKGLLERNYSLYVYNERMKDMIARWKYRGDAVIGQAFYRQIHTAYVTHCEGCTPVPIPLSRERLEERGFNQAEMLASSIGAPLSFREKLRQHSTPTVQHALLRPAHVDKQSKKSRQQRISSEIHPFQFNKKTSIKGKDIVILDDIYTTGSTLRKAAEVLKTHGAEKICSITLARG